MAPGTNVPSGRARLPHVTTVAGDFASNGQALNTALNLQDVGGEGQSLNAVQQQATAELAWANANPPADCYRTVWQAFHDAMNSFVQATAIAMPWVRSLTESFATYPPDAARFTKAGGDALGSIATLETSIHC